MNANSATQPEVVRALARAKQEADLDEALRETFPCSDPIAVSCLVERDASRRVSGSADTQLGRKGADDRAEEHSAAERAG